MTTAPKTPLTIEHNGRALVVTDPIHVEKLAGWLVLSDVGFRVYHLEPGVSWKDVTAKLEE